MKDLNSYVSDYKKQLVKGDIVKAYTALVKFVMHLRNTVRKRHSDRYSFSGLLHGYLDYTYFYFSNAFLKKRKLKFGLILNHTHMRFELWLLGNTSADQKYYWDLLKTSPWCNSDTKMPEYAILEIILIENPDFNDLDSLTEQLETKMCSISEDLSHFVKDMAS